MNSFELISLHHQRYPKSRLTPDTVDTIICQMMRLTSGVDSKLRPILIRGTLYEMVYRSYQGKEADELRERIYERYDAINDSCCLCLHLLLV